ncbi:uncharacterized protein PFL1_03455 [Pseudozyma flocculosa PF-1]|uniref:Related to small nuclear ribonucleoprotein snRNP U1A n=2 Tax=Pseudozyma flocculosa TaxID=84751 RepID=A0A5C3FAS7_9BASI|nr:uncharacterized protein PFL1_03455 [Pseudozyma flocculosa PF-1]EPQ29168.1 hypothetical protein PFL1_03455 [Pseudozyma flocculosa PF-1]SPO41533.1 related to small nuclear ribonucleoprotein snRNP U1A [Pseudozyma flocculosa]
MSATPSSTPASLPAPAPTGAAQDVQMGDATADAESQPLPSDANKTLYLNNLNEKVKLPIMKETLQNLFTNYGKVLSVVAHDNHRMRGQAFVVLEDERIADKARREVHNFPLYGKPIQVNFARTKSDAAVLKETGGSQEMDEFKQHKQARLERKKISRRDNPLRRKELEKKIRAKKAAAGELDDETMEAAAGPSAARRPGQEMPDEYLPPNKTLFLQNIPDGVGKGELESLFSGYSGYTDIQTIPGKASIAFVEYADIPSSVAARSALNGYNFGAGDKLKITFARA